MRDGCYQIESGGGTGGAGYARDSQAGCHLPADVAAVFARLGAIAGDALVRDGAGRGGAAGGARAEGFSPGGSQTRVVLIRPDGSRWVAANKATADDMLRAVNDLPSENQWYAKPPVQAGRHGRPAGRAGGGGQSRRAPRQRWRPTAAGGASGASSARAVAIPSSRRRRRPWRSRTRPPGSAGSSPGRARARATRTRPPPPSVPTETRPWSRSPGPAWPAARSPGQWPTRWRIASPRR